MASDFELQVLAELSDIKTVAATAAQAAIAAKEAALMSTQAMNDRLFHPQSGVIAVLQSDIQEIKDDRIRDEKWEKIHNVLHYSLTPIVVAAHAVARHLGIDI
jgi:hypothetical protein